MRVHYNGRDSVNMRYTTKLYNNKKASVTIPVFFFGEGTNREEENVRRMNSFYEELRGSVFSYTESPDFPEGGRYFAKTQVTDCEDGIEVKVIMRLRCPEGIRGKTLIHRWRDGVITKKELF